MPCKIVPLGNYEYKSGLGVLQSEGLRRMETENKSIQKDLPGQGNTRYRPICLVDIRSASPKRLGKLTHSAGVGMPWGVKPTHTLPPETDPSRQKRPLRHLRIAFKLSYLDKTYIRRLKYNLTATNCKRAQKCLGKTFNRRLIKMSTYDVPKTSFKDVSQIDFFKFQKKRNVLLLFTYFLLSYIWSKRCHKVKFPTSLL